MKYLFNLQPKTPMHYWDTEKQQTYCGKDVDGIQTRTNPGRELCKDCKQALANRNHSPKYKL